MLVVDQDQLNQYVANEEYVVRIPHHSLIIASGYDDKKGIDKLEFSLRVQQGFLDHTLLRDI